MKRYLWKCAKLSTLLELSHNKYTFSPFNQTGFKYCIFLRWLKTEIVWFSSHVGTSFQLHLNHFMIKSDFTSFLKIIMVSGEGLQNYRMKSFLTSSWVEDGRTRGTCECEQGIISWPWVAGWVQRSKTSQVWPLGTPAESASRPLYITLNLAGLRAQRASCEEGSPPPGEAHTQADQQGPTELSSNGRPFAPCAVVGGSAGPCCAVGDAAGLSEAIDTVHSSQLDRPREHCSTASTRLASSHLNLSCWSHEMFTSVTRKGNGSRVYESS